MLWTNMKRFGLILGLLSTPVSVRAQDDVSTLNVTGWFAGGITWSTIINSILKTLGNTIFFVAAAAFMLGALMYTAGFINEENKSKGKQLMIGALFGMAVVLAAGAIFNTAYFFIYGE